MPSDAFTRSLPFVLRWEGGYVDHPADPGGATHQGVTQQVYDDWRRAQGLAPRDVRQLEPAEMQTLYETRYWQPARCDTLPRRLDLAQFDTAVNMGTGRAVRFLQAALGCAVDGGFGEATLRAVHGCNDLARTLVDYCDARAAYYDRLVAAKPALAVFRKGWMNRLDALRKEMGLPGYEAASDAVDFGGVDHLQRIPDLGVDASFDL